MLRFVDQEPRVHKSQKFTLSGTKAKDRKGILGEVVLPLLLNQYEQAHQLRMDSKGNGYNKERYPSLSLINSALYPLFLCVPKT